MTPAAFGTKLAYVKLTPATQSASAAKPLQPAVKPATPPTQSKTMGSGNVKWVMRAAPSVPNPIAPPPTAKAAECKAAPQYTASGKTGKRIMPQPHARRTINLAPKTAPEFGKAVAEA